MHNLHPESNMKLDLLYRMAARQRQLTGAIINSKERIGRDIILTYDTSRLWYVLYAL